MTAVSLLRRFLANVFQPAPGAQAKRMHCAADRIERAAKRLEDSADSFGVLVRDMRGRARPSTRPAPRRKKR